MAQQRQTLPAGVDPLEHSGDEGALEVGARLELTGRQHGAMHVADGAPTPHRGGSAQLYVLPEDGLAHSLTVYFQMTTVHGTQKQTLEADCAR